ncbi:hypothetical protein GIB67_006492 [Kingdonia uniflora]|uniref:Auxin-responsive protein n=1 Tax=Kingdonia uniflora TaxID=39325 RepID=A0A7J7LEJ0_9MAGN|nr:hypothetical protein GIB67_006492 [Kingdonia uniflora]
MGSSQVVGWPPVRAHRIKSLADHRSVDAEIDKIEDYMNKKKEDSTKNHIVREKIHQGDSLFVKVNRDGDPIGRKVDVCAHACYETLAKALEEMFDNPTTSAYSICSTCDNEHGVEVTKPSKLLKGSSDFALTYEDKDGDLMLAGDVPWR